MDSYKQRVEDQSGAGLEGEVSIPRIGPLIGSGTEEHSTELGAPEVPERKRQRESRSKPYEKAEYLTHARKREKNLQHSYSASYQELYNEEAIDLLPYPDHPYKPELLESNNYGLIPWTSDEEHAFFRAVSREGRHNVQAIANHIKTKSEIEVQAFLQALEKGILRDTVDEARYRLLRYEEFPAAYEVSEECRQALDTSAAALAYRQYNYEIDVEGERHGDLWILDLRAAERLASARENADSMDAEPIEDPKLQEAYDVLDLERFINLSFQVFMNSRNAEYNWRKIVKSHHSPSILHHGPSLFCTAFLDFHNLVIGITKRLISSSIFAAESRLRITGNIRKEVTKADAITAVDILGLKRNTFHYWQGVPRRCNLKVHEEWQDVHRLVPGRTLSFDEVEEQLQRPNNKKQIEIVTKGGEGAGEKQVEDEPASDASSGFGSPVRLSANEKEMEERAVKDEAEDEYAEYLDMIDSRKHERKMWKMLKRKPVEQPVSTADNKMKRPRFWRKPPEDLVDWQAWCEYKSEWESFKKQPTRRMFEENQQYRRKQIPDATADKEQSSTDEDIGEDGASDIESSSTAEEDEDGEEESLDKLASESKHSGGSPQSESLPFDAQAGYTGDDVD